LKVKTKKIEQFVAVYPLLGTFQGINHGTTPPTISQNIVTRGKATYNDKFAIPPC